MRGKFCSTVFLLVLSAGLCTPAFSQQVAPNDPTEIKLPCDETGKFGKQKCDRLKPTLIEQMNVKLAHIMAYYYEGHLVEFNDSIDPVTNTPVFKEGFCRSAKIQTPVCEIGRAQTPEINSNTYNGDRCGGTCNFNSDGVIPATCRSENAWVRGFRVSAWEKIRRELEDEINSGKIKITRFGQDAPCGYLAASFDSQIRAIDLAEASIVGKYQTVIDELGVSAFDGCLGVEKENLSGPGIQEQAAADRAAEEKAKEKHYDRTIAGLPKEKGRISHAVCNLTVARFQTQSLFSKVTFCELMMRSKKDYYERYISGDTLFKGIKEKVIDRCTAYAKRARGGLEGKATAIRKYFEPCYKNRIGNFFKNYSRQNFDNPLAPVRQKLNDPRTNLPIDPAEIKDCAALSLYRLARRQGNRKTKRARIGAALVALALLGLVLMFAGGCNDQGDFQLAPAICPHNGETMGWCRIDGTEGPCVSGYIRSEQCAGLEKKPPPPFDPIPREEREVQLQLAQLNSVQTEDGNEIVKKLEKKKDAQTATLAATAAHRSTASKTPGQFGDANANGNPVGQGEAKTGANANGFQNSGSNKNGTGMAQNYSSPEAKQSGGLMGSDSKSAGAPLPDTVKNEVPSDANSKGAQGFLLGERSSSLDRPDSSETGSVGSGETSELALGASPVGKLSLFEVVSRRYMKWGRELEATDLQHRPLSGLGNP